MQVICLMRKKEQYPTAGNNRKYLLHKKLIAVGSNVVCLIQSNFFVELYFHFINHYLSFFVPNTLNKKQRKPKNERCKE